MRVLKLTELVGRRRLLLLLLLGDGTTFEERSEERSKQKGDVEQCGPH